MEDFYKIIRNINKRFDLPSNLGISSQLTEMVRSQQIWKQNFSGLDMLMVAAKEAARQHKAFTTTADLASSLQHSIKIPQITFDAIQSINHNHSMLLGGRKNISDMLLASNGLNTWRNAINILSSQVATLGKAQQKWDLIDDFKLISKETTNITEKIIDQKAVTKEDIKELKDIIERVEVKLINHDKDFITIIYHYVFIVYAIIFIFSHILEWTNPEAASKEDIEKAKTEILSTLQHKIWQKKFYRSTLRSCKVFTKPNTKSSVVATLPKDCDITVIVAEHKWVSVTYINPTDGYPETGWVLKKYLSKQKFIYDEK